MATTNFTTGTVITSEFLNDVQDAEHLSYTPTGAGAVATTVQAKLRESASVKDFGAVGDGVTDDTVAIQKAALTSGPFGILYFTSGTYKVSSDLTISTSAIFSDAKITVESGKTLTINGTVFAATKKIFEGLGSVVVSNDTPIIFPEWWGADGNDVLVDSQPGITAAIANSSSQGNTVYFSGSYAIGSTVTVLNTSLINASRTSTIRALAGSGITNGIIMGAGNALGRFVLPTLVNFTGVALEVRCALANIYVPQFNTCGICIKFNSGHSGVTSNVLDTVVEFDAIAASTTAVNFNHNFVTDVMQGCGVKGNFITNTINAVIFSGTSASNDGLFLRVLAIDFVNGNGAFLDNQTGTFISRFTASVDSWFGGAGFVAGTPTQFVKGIWVNSVLDIVSTRAFDQSNFTPNLLQATKLALRQWVSKAAAIEMVPLATGLVGFNSGLMMYNTNATMKHTLAADLLVGASVASYFWHVAGDANYSPWKINLTEINVANAGAIVERINDQTGTEAGRVAVVTRNIGSITIPAGSILYYHLERDF